MIAMPKEEYAIILDFLATGYPGSRFREPVAQAIGDKFFSLLELIPKEGSSLSQGERVYIGEGKRDKIKLIKRRLGARELTNVASGNLDDILTDLIRKNEKEIIEFFNKAGTVTPRLHQLELLPGVGKRYVEAIIRNRPFESFEDLAKKTELHDPIKIIKRRILDEMSGMEKYYLLTRPIKM
jgi:putative nucleotide binding protein